MTSESLTAEIVHSRHLANAAEANSANLTLKFQGAIEACIDKGAIADPAGTISGFSLNDDDLTSIARVCGAYRDFQTAEAARRSSLRTPPPPQINLPPSLKPGGVKIAPTGPPNG